MSDISKIKINDTTYDIKDPDARTIANSAVAAANDANTNANNRVSKSGDTMTGEFIVQDHHISIKKPNTDISANSISSAQYAVIGAKDVNDLYLGYFQSTQYANGDVLVQLSARNKQTGQSGSFDNGLGLRANKDGTRSISLTDTSAWLSALGFTDSGWKALNTSHNCYYRKFGPIVTVVISTSTSFATGEHSMGTLPSGYRPKYTAFTITHPNNSRFSVNEAGYVVMISQGSTGIPTRCCCSFLVA